MPLTLEIIERIVPPGLPPWKPRTDKEQRKAEYLRSQEGTDGPLIRSYFWQKYLTEKIRDRRSWLSDSLTALAYPDELLQQAIGFIEIDASFASNSLVQRATAGTSYFFGAILYDHRAGQEGLHEALDIGGIEDSAKGIPAVHFPAADILHAPHPAGATASCRAAKRGSKQEVRYFVTAKHSVLGLGRGQRVPLEGGGFGSLVDYCAGAVDAALIGSPCRAISSNSLAIDIDPAIGSDVYLIGSGGGQKSGRITKTWVFPTDTDPYDPQRVHFDFTGVHGDSGALVRLAATDEAIGIYTGIKQGRSTQSGMSQAIWQAVELLDIKLFE